MNVILSFQSFIRFRIVFYFYCIARSVSLEIDSFFQRSCYKTIETIEKYEKNRSAAKEQDIGESYYRLAIFCSKHHQSGSNENRFEMSELLIKSVLRGMRFGSKNARLQFPRILQLPAINTMKLTAVFNEEVIKRLFNYCQQFFMF